MRLRRFTDGASQDLLAVKRCSCRVLSRYGDHLYSKSDYEGAMSCYLKTVGTVQASYVIRKVRIPSCLTRPST